MTEAFETVKKVIEKFGTCDCFAIAEKSGVRIVYESWHPATVGEFDRKAKTISVNLCALTDDKYSKEAVVAHELGHFFATEFNLSRADEETFAVEFAEKLTNTDGESI
jgi:Zn-dependent peptidase ImmA (M78 family)